MSQSPARKARRKGLVAPTKRNLTPEETLQLQLTEQYINARKFEAIQVRGNTALVPDGQKLADQLDAVVALLENAKHSWFNSVLRDCGYIDTVCDVNLATGEIIPKNEA